jgi:Yip1 domain
LSWPGYVPAHDEREPLIASGSCANVSLGGFAMEFVKRLIKRLLAILLRPHAEWRVIAEEKSEPAALFVHYVAILALVPALARFIGAALVGGYAPIWSSLAGALVVYLAGFVTVYGLALIIDALAAMFGAQKDFAAALKVAVYSATPVWIAGIFLLVPGLSFLVILGLHGIYLLWTGLPILMRAPPERGLAYAAAVGGCALVIAVGLGLSVAPLFSAPA